MSTLTDTGIWSLQKTRALLNKAHKDACDALLLFEAARADNSLPAEDRIAARSLLDQTKTLCTALSCAMNAVPDVAQPKAIRLTADTRQPPSCIRTAKSMLEGFRAKKKGPVAMSVQYGSPVLN